jgi:NAD(P)-dependent dehydrogenase (short-subunit alcohol dehydrogenase family)/acyl carrier protein
MVADVSDAEQMRRVLQGTLGKFQSLHGVIHAAGIARAGLIQATTREMTEAMLSPKVDGTLVLHELLAGIDLDFLVLFSSMASITGPFAHADYSAANAFLDAFAPYSNAQRKYHTVAINWPVWKEVGMVAKLEAFMGVEDWRDEALKKAILTKDGLEAFRRVLQSDLPQVIVSPEDLLRLLAQSREMSNPMREISRTVTAGDATAANAAPIPEADQPSDEIETLVAGIWSKAFGLPQIGVHERFTDLGGHSLLALQIVTRTRSAYGVDIALRDFFESPTIAQFSTLIREKLILEIAGLTDDEVRELIANDAEQTLEPDHATQPIRANE